MPDAGARDEHLEPLAPGLWPTADGQIVGEDLSCWPTEVPVLSGCTEREARYFITLTGRPYGAPGMDPAQLYTANTLANMAKVLLRSPHPAEQYDEVDAQV
ncbi:MAG: hypothetical protein LC749_18670 [Actinobacteria bacterium]|nr:hypothetical protein [Actinomycetota bacterium]